MFKLVKASAIKSRGQAINQLKAVLVGTDPALRDSMTGLSNPALFRRCTELNHSNPTDTPSAAAFTLRLLARRILELSSEIDELNAQIATTIEARAPQLLQRYGVGPDTAAALLLAAGDNPERLYSEASFAALCGVSPIEASSGKMHRRRLNRGGDRQANSALYTITIARLRWDKRTADAPGHGVFAQRRVGVALAEFFESGVGVRQAQVVGGGQVRGHLVTENAQSVLHTGARLLRGGVGTAQVRIPERLHRPTTTAWWWWVPTVRRLPHPHGTQQAADALRAAHQHPLAPADLLAPRGYPQAAGSADQRHRRLNTGTRQHQSGFTPGNAQRGQPGRSAGPARPRRW